MRLHILRESGTQCAEKQFLYSTCILTRYMTKLIAPILSSGNILKMAL